MAPSEKGGWKGGDHTRTAKILRGSYLAHRYVSLYSATHRLLPRTLLFVHSTAASHGGVLYCYQAALSTKLCSWDNQHIRKARHGTLARRGLGTVGKEHRSA